MAAQGLGLMLPLHNSGGFSDGRRWATAGYGSVCCTVCSEAGLHRIVQAWTIDAEARETGKTHAATAIFGVLPVSSRDWK